MNKIEDLIAKAHAYTEAWNALGSKEADRAVKYLQAIDVAKSGVAGKYSGCLEFDLDICSFYMETAYCSCCSQDIKWVPHFALMSDEDCDKEIASSIEQIRKQRAEKEAKEAAEVALRAEEKERTDRETYLKLKAKYEPT